MTSPQKPLDQILLDALSSDKSILQATTQTLNDMAKSNLSDFLIKLGEILYNEQQEKRIRQMAAIIFKNVLLRDQQNKETYLTKVTPQEKKTIKENVLGSLASGMKEIRTISSNLIASICKVEQPIETNWPELLSSLTENCFNDNLNFKLSAIETLGYVCEEISLKDISQNVLNNILNALVGNIKEGIENMEVIQYSLRAFTSCIKFSEAYFSKENERKIIMESIFNLIKKYSAQDDVLDKIAMLFIEMFSRSNFYDYIEVFMAQIFEFSFFLIKNKAASNERLSLLGLEILCTLGDEEDKREASAIAEYNPGNITIFNPNAANQETQKKRSKKYFDKISVELQKMIIENVKFSEDEDDSEWNLSKGCLYILSILVKVCEIKNINDFFKQLEDQIKQNLNNPQMRCKCWLLLSSALNTKYRDMSFKIISQFLKNILSDIEPNQNPIVQNCASFLLKKATKNFPKTIDINKLEPTLTVLLSTLTNCNSNTGINICQTIQNIITSYGDPQTRKSSNNLSPLFTKLINGLFVPAEVELSSQKDEFGKLSLTRLMTIDTLISNTSHDKQESLIEILLQYLKQIEFTHSNYSALLGKGVKEEKIRQLQDFYYTLLRSIFKKYQKPIDMNLAKNIWILTDQIFKFRKTVFEEANIALGALATNMKESFTEIFNQYFPFLEFSIKKFDESNLSKTGLATLLAIIRGIQGNIKGQSENILKILISVCTSNDVTRQNKTIAISCIGEIAINLGSVFSTYLNEIMTLLFSACELAISGVDDDEDTIQFIKELRYELIQTFTCIEFALEDKINLFVPHIPNVFKFFKTIVNDKKYMREDILFSLMNFVCDMINTFGMEIKPLCEKEFLIAIIGNLQSYNNPAYVDEIKKSQNLFELLFCQ